MKLTKSEADLVTDILISVDTSRRQSLEAQRLLWKLQKLIEKD